MQKRRMYLNCFFAVAMCLGLAFALLPTAYGQETTGGIKGYVKDRSGATVAKAQVELSGPALLTPRKGETDSAGYFYFQLLPPGEYTISVSSQGFRAYKQTGIQLEWEIRRIGVGV